MTQCVQKKINKKSKQNKIHLGAAPNDIFGFDDELKQIRQEEAKNKRKPITKKTSVQKPYPTRSKTASTRKLSTTKKSIKSSAEKPYPTQSNSCKTASTHKLCSKMQDSLDPMHKINAECNRINSACNKNHKLKSLQLKLAIFEKKTFKKIKYDSKCVHTDCKEKAPKDFPSSDLYICTKHARQAGLDCQEKLRSIAYKLCEGASSMKTDEKMNDKYQPRQQSVDAVMRIPDGFIESLMDGSINQTAKYPKYYWSLLMTKLLTRFRYEKSLGHRKNPERIRLITNVLKLLMVFRYFMNPIGAQLLTFIIGILPHIGSIGPVLQALNGMVVVILNSVVAMYAVAFMLCVALAYDMVNGPTNTAQVVAWIAAGTALTIVGGIVCVATLGIGAPVSAPLFGSGFGCLMKAAKNGHDNNNSHQGNGPNNNNPGNGPNPNDNNPGNGPNGNNPGNGNFEGNDNARDAVNRLAEQNLEVVQKLNNINDNNET
eukprot:214633_1